MGPREQTQARSQSPSQPQPTRPQCSPTFVREMAMATLGTTPHHPQHPTHHTCNTHPPTHPQCSRTFVREMAMASLGTTPAAARRFMMPCTNWWGTHSSSTLASLGGGRGAGGEGWGARVVSCAVSRCSSSSTLASLGGKRGGVGVQGSGGLARGAPACRWLHQRQQQRQQQHEEEEPAACNHPPARLPTHHAHPPTHPAHQPRPTHLAASSREGQATTLSPRGKPGRYFVFSWRSLIRSDRLLLGCWVGGGVGDTGGKAYKRALRAARRAARSTAPAPAAPCCGPPLTPPPLARARMTHRPSTSSSYTHILTSSTKRSPGSSCAVLRATSRTAAHAHAPGEGGHERARVGRGWAGWAGVQRRALAHLFADAAGWQEEQLGHSPEPIMATR